MGKHSAPKKGAFSDVTDLLGAFRPAKPGRRASRETTPQRASATSILKKVNRRPVLSAIAVPVAASAAIVTSATVVTSNGSDAEEQQAQFASNQAPEADDAKPAQAPKKAQKDSEGDSLSLDARAPETPSSSPSSSGDSTSSNGSAGSKSAKGSKDSSGAASGGASSNVSGEKCSVSSSIESGLSSNAVRAYRAVCAEFPQVKSYGGRRSDPGSDHNSGNAVDIMITGSTGDQIADYLIKNSSKLNVKYVIWEQRIWMPGRGWKGMSDRGGATANHFDHVHVSVK